MRHRQVAQTVSHVMLDHMSSSGVMHGDSRRRGEEVVKHEVKEKNIAAVHTWYHNMVSDRGHRCKESRTMYELEVKERDGVRLRTRMRREQDNVLPRGGEGA